MSNIKKLALINVRVESRQRIPIGLLTLAGCTKDLCKTVIFDPDPDEKDIREIVNFDPDLVGISFMTQTKGRARELSDWIRAKLPGAKVILGGVGPTVEKENIFRQFKPDALVIGEGEKALIRIVKGEPWNTIPGVYLPDSAFTSAEVMDNLDDIPLPAYECMPDIKKYFCPPGGIRGKWFAHGTPMIMTGRGCPYRCTFCSSHLMFGRTVRRRSADSVIREIRKLHNDFDIYAVYFFDDTFNAPPSWTKEFCEKLLKEPYRITWGCQARVNLLDSELARIMRNAGCVQVDIGVESGSPKVLKALHKDETVEQIETAFAACHRAGLAPMGTFLVGCPEETREDVELTRNLVKKIKPSFSEFFYLIPYPGSELYGEAVEKKWIVDFSYEGRGMVDRPVMEINFSLEQQRKIRRDYFRLTSFANLKGYLTPNIILAVAGSIRPAMIRAFLSELTKTWNIRDAMQAFAHALRKWHAERN